MRGRSNGRRPNADSVDETASDDVTEFDHSEMLSADLLYDRRWALTVLDRVFARLCEESRDQLTRRCSSG